MNDTKCSSRIAGDTKCTFAWSDSRKPTPESRDKTAQLLRSLRKQGFVFRLRANHYRAKVTGYDVVAIINTRA